MKIFSYDRVALLSHSRCRNGLESVSNQRVSQASSRIKETLLIYTTTRQGMHHHPTSGLSGRWLERYMYEITLKYLQKPNRQPSLLCFSWRQAHSCLFCFFCSDAQAVQMDENQRGACWSVGKCSPVSQHAGSCLAANGGKGQSEPGLAVDVSHPSFPITQDYFTLFALTTLSSLLFFLLVSRAGKDISRAAKTQPGTAGECRMRPLHRREWVGSFPSSSVGKSCLCIHGTTGSHPIWGTTEQRRIGPQGGEEQAEQDKGLTLLIVCTNVGVF